MTRWKPTLPMVLALVTGLTLMYSTPARAQTRLPDPEGHAPWPLIDSLGYGALGLGLGVLVASSMEPSSGFGPDGGQVVSILLGTIGGTVAGLEIGGRAIQKSDARRLGSGHHTAAVLGTVFLGAGLGALAAVPQVSGEETDTSFGSDEETVTLFTMVGTGLGALGAWWLWGDLTPNGIAVAPTMTTGGELGLQLGTRF